MLYIYVGSLPFVCMCVRKLISMLVWECVCVLAFVPSLSCVVRYLYKEIMLRI